MRMLNKNKQQLYYANFVKGGEPIYKEVNGEKVISYVDDEGNVYYEEIGTTQSHYTEPIPLKGNISMSGNGEAEAVEFGLNLADYSAVLVVAKNCATIDETTYIWHNSEVVVDSNGYADKQSADYRVVKVSPSLNVDKFVLAKVVK
jgi:hypothetical protein